jgi:structure-specific endonuclease subunit SLX1
VIKSEKWSRKHQKTITKIGQPPISLENQIHNMHLMLRSKSFERWPLSVRFFATDVYNVFQKWDSQSTHHVRPGIDITLDPLATPEQDKKRRKKKGELSEPQIDEGIEPVIPRQNPIELLDFSYLGMKPHLKKVMEKLVPGANVTCAVCKVRIETDHALTVVCPHNGCGATSHMQCLSGEFLRQENDVSTDGGSVVPVEGHCPSCHSRTNWSTLVEELSLRTRGQKEVEKLFKQPRRKKGDATDDAEIPTATLEALAEASEAEVYAYESEEERKFLEFEEEALKTASQELAAETSTPKKRRKRSPKAYVNDSDWDDVEILD